MFGDRTELSTSVEVYHAGLTAGRRKKIQNNFMKGKHCISDLKIAERSRTQFK